MASQWSQQQVAQGNCARCGQKRTTSKQLCDSCKLKRREYMREFMRKLKGFKPYTKGQRGRPPLALNHG